MTAAPTTRDERAAPGAAAGESPSAGAVANSRSHARPRGRWRSALIRITLRTALRVMHAAQSMFERLVPRRRPGPDGARVLVTGKFLSDTWVSSFLRPMAQVKGCGGVWAVAAFPIPQPPGVHAVYPPRWMQRVFGQAVARTVTFAFWTLRLRPHVIGGFHLLINGLAAGLLARMIGARSFYVSVGGPNELNDGGLHSENSLFARIESPDPALERLLLRAAGRFDRVVTMGRRAAENYRQRGVGAEFHVIPGAIDTERFRRVDVERDLDLVLVGRLVEVKRIDVFLEAVAIVARTLPTIRAAIVGDGPMRSELECRASALRLADIVHFAGQQKQVEQWYQRSKIFALTSDSEGLSLAMLEAMSCGTVPVVSAVGDLGDMIEQGQSGFLVDRRRPDLFAQRFVEVLGDPARLAELSRAAQAAAERVALEPSIQRWQPVIAEPV